ncbi:unnamed protein product [Prorocentrum cordatum]|uniref:Mediator of RNA polymerase II transcription subunit 4 n=1 Tax=Prorocentrum cordatum TaxID=2364126 RepID=A0ABN9XBV2_9DINO|nr:unnamed protein product [Polarella glacialis]
MEAQQFIAATPPVPKQLAPQHPKYAVPPATPAQQQAYRKDTQAQVGALSTLILATRRSGAEDADPVEELSAIKHAGASLEPIGTWISSTSIDLENAKLEIAGLERKIEEASSEREVFLHAQQGLEDTLSELMDQEKAEQARRGAEAAAQGITAPPPPRPPAAAAPGPAASPSGPVRMTFPPRAPTPPPPPFLPPFQANPISATGMQTSRPRSRSARVLDESSSPGHQGPGQGSRPEHGLACKFPSGPSASTSAQPEPEEGGGARPRRSQNRSCRHRTQRRRATRTPWRTHAPVARSQACHSHRHQYEAL